MTYDAIIFEKAIATGYTEEEAKAGLMFAARKSRRNDPPGSFDRAGRFEAAERTQAVLKARAPSRRFPYAEMGAARTAAHCAELYGADSVIAVKRVCRARDFLGSDEWKESAHGLMAAMAELDRIMKPVKR